MIYCITYDSYDAFLFYAFSVSISIFWLLYLWKCSSDITSIENFCVCHLIIYKEHTPLRDWACSIIWLRKLILVFAVIHFCLSLISSVLFWISSSLFYIIQDRYTAYLIHLYYWNINLIIIVGKIFNSENSVSISVSTNDGLGLKTPVSKYSRSQK